MATSPNKHTIQRGIQRALLITVIPAIFLTAAGSLWLGTYFIDDAANELRSSVTQIARSRMTERVQKKIAEVRQVATSTVVTTGLLDTNGRDKYLQPYLEERTSASGAAFIIYDYRGRPLLSGDPLSPQPRPNPELTSLETIRFQLDGDGLLIESPVRSAYDNVIIGYLVARSSIEEFLSEAQVLPSRFFDVSANLHIFKKGEVDPAWFIMVETDTEAFAATIEVEANSLWFRENLRYATQIGGGLLVLILSSSILFARSFARNISRPLLQLTSAADLFRRGRIGQLPSSDVEEVNQLARALEMTFLERRTLERKLQQAADYDPLMGIMSRGHFDEQAQHAIAECKGLGGAILLFIDLDQFKQVNDRHGHAAGDEVLKTVATRIRSHLRKTDLVGRRGGDELTILLTRIDIIVALKIAHELLQTIRQSIVIPDIGTVCIGASIGLAQFPEDGSSFDELVAAADQAMYVAKCEGRGRVVCASHRELPNG